MLAILKVEFMTEISSLPLKQDWITTVGRGVIWREFKHCMEWEECYTK